MNARKNDELTPEVEAWRARNPIRLWVDTDPWRKLDRLKRLRERFGLSKSALYRWMHGKSLPTADKLVVVCKMAGVSPAAYMKWFKAYPPEAAARSVTTAGDPEPDEDSE